jgi:formylglycine-generating enzyme required for sulfatase activity
VAVLQVGNDFLARGESDTLPYEALPPRAKRVASLRTVGGVLQVIPHVAEAAALGGLAGPTLEIPPRQLAAGEQWRFSIPACTSVTLRTDAESVRLEPCERPEWADAWGMDGYGVWADLRVKEVVVRWRWIAPGSFLMGSPEPEPGRYSDEGPQHWVTLTRGYWMMATPCTQQLWTALMPKNPSSFQDPARPVENVSWNDVAEFVERLNDHSNLKRQRGPQSGESPPTGFRLPTEAQWEYACRAGSTTALYRVPGSTGQIDIFGDHNSPAIDPIAWYGGNCGVGFELKDGEDSRGWPEKQFAHQRAGSRPVARKQPNMWGLHDMLGNVWEWCRDVPRKYGVLYVDDPGEHLGEDSSEKAMNIGSRCVRGGCWGSLARYVRCASRGQGASESRSEYLGFRLVSVQDRS